LTPSLTQTGHRRYVELPSAEPVAVTRAQLLRNAALKKRVTMGGHTIDVNSMPGFYYARFPRHVWLRIMGYVDCFDELRAVARLSMEFYTAVRVDWQSARESFDAVGIDDGGGGNEQSSSLVSGHNGQHQSGNGDDSGSGDAEDGTTSAGARRMFALIDHMKNYCADSLRRLAIVESAAFHDAHALGTEPRVRDEATITTTNH
jgi:hypothetical protein